MQITLKAARVNRGLTLEEAANQIQKELKSLGISRNVSADVVSNWERGLTVPNVNHVKAIEKVYQVGYNDLNFLP